MRSIVSPAGAVRLIAIALLSLAALPARSKDVTAQPAAKAEVPAWQARFDEMYRLAPGENAKLIQPPFIPERDQFHKKNRPGNSIAGQYRLRWEQDKPFTNITWSSDSTVESAVSAAGLAVADLEGIRDVFEIEVPGDWVIREGASREDTLTDVRRAITKATNGQVKFEPAKAEREVIVARGTYAFKPMPNATRDPKNVQLFTDAMDAKPADSPGGTSSLAGLLGRIGRCAERKVINEVNPHEGKVSWADHRSADTAAKSPERLQQLLKNVSEQTALIFAVERRRVDVWRVIDTTGKVGGL